MIDEKDINSSTIKVRSSRPKFLLLHSEFYCSYNRSYILLLTFILKYFQSQKDEVIIIVRPIYQTNEGFDDSFAV